MKEHISTLIQLQEIETESRHIRAALDKVTEHLDELDRELEKNGEEITQETAWVEEMRKAYRADESNVQDNLSQIESKTESLSKIETNDAYQALLKEIEGLKKKNAQTEDGMLSALEKIEAADRDIQRKKKAYEELKTRTEEEKNTLTRKTDQQRKRFDELNAEWKKLAGSIDSSLMKRIDMLKERTGGTAIASVKNAVCQGCNMNIPPQMYNELQRIDELRFCPYCQRIIYWKKPKPAADPKQDASS